VRPRTWIVATATYVGLLAAFWITARFLDFERHIGGHLTSSFAAFALLFAPYWFFGFGLAQVVRDRVRARAVRILLRGLLVLAYVVFALPRADVRLPYALAMLTIPVGVTALFELLPPAVNALTWQDAVALLIVGLPAEFGWLRPAWPQSGMGSMPKLLLMDAGLYAFLVVRGLERVGYDFRFRLRDLVVGFREWAFFALFGIGIGLALRFILFRGWATSVWMIATGWLVTFFFVAIPEEFYFRGLLQNLLEPRLGRQRALMLATAIFGLSHFNKPLPFAWRYVLLATIAGVFYGRAWRDRRRLTASAITHTGVDVVWSVWFR